MTIYKYLLYMSDYHTLEEFLRTGRLTPNACYYFDPPLDIDEMNEMQIVFRNIVGNDFIVKPLRYLDNPNEIVKLLWFETNKRGDISGWQNPINRREEDDVVYEEELLNYIDVENWFDRFEPHKILINGRDFISKEHAADLFDKLQESKLNEIGSKRAKDTDVIYRDSNLVVVVPLSYESAKSFSRGTQYCTGGDCSRGNEATSKGMYNSHIKRGDILYRILFKNGTKVRLTWNGDINDRDFHWGLGKKNDYPVFTSRNMDNPFDLEKLDEVRMNQLELEFEQEPKQKEFDEWEKKFCNKYSWDTHNIYDVLEKIRKKWGMPDWRDPHSKPMDPVKHKKMQEEEEEVYNIWQRKKREIMGKYLNQTHWWNDKDNETLYKAIKRIPEEAITKMIEYVVGKQYKPVPIKEDVYLRDDIRNINVGDTIWVSRVNPDLNNCDSDSYDKLERLIGKVLTVVGKTDDADLCQNDDEQYSGDGILVYHPELEGHNGFGNSQIEDKNGENICKYNNCWWINDFYATFTKGEPFDTHGAFDTLFEQEGDDEFGWVSDAINLPQNLSVSHLGKHKITKLTLEDIKIGAMIRRYNGKFLYEIGEPTQFNIGGVMQPGYMLKNLSNGKNYFTKISQMLREFYLISS